MGEPDPSAHGMIKYLSTRVALLSARLALYAWDESKHPRHPKGSGDGGEFAPKELSGIAEEVTGIRQILNEAPINWFQSVKVSGSWAKQLSDRLPDRSGPKTSDIDLIVEAGLGRHEINLNARTTWLSRRIGALEDRTGRKINLTWDERLGSHGIPIWESKDKSGWGQQEMLVPGRPLRRLLGAEKKI